MIKRAIRNITPMPMGFRCAPNPPFVIPRGSYLLILEAECTWMTTLHNDSQSPLREVDSSGNQVYE